MYSRIACIVFGIVSLCVPIVEIYSNDLFIKKIDILYVFNNPKRLYKSLLLSSFIMIILGIIASLVEILTIYKKNKRIYINILFYFCSVCLITSGFVLLKETITVTSVIYLKGGLFSPFICFIVSVLGAIF